jgi:predicted dehydrogenase
MSHEIDRRAFIKRAAGTGATVSMAVAGPLTRTVLGANDRVRVGVVGTGRQGLSNLRAFKDNGAQIVGVCDVYEPNLKKGIDAAGPGVKSFTDFRKLLDEPDIDLVINATPDHWHALPMVMACQAGKDVFVEKPASVAIDEGKKMIEAARKHKRVVQVALWQRSHEHFARAAQVIQQGFIGKVSFVRTWNYGNAFPEGIGNPPDSEPPAGLDWDMWLGPAPKVPFNANRFGIGDRWSTFRYFYDYANGWLGDWAVHLIDIVHLAMRVDGPVAATASGSKYLLKDNADTPDTLQVTLEYPGFLCVYENRQANSNSMWGKGYGIEFHGSDGTMFVDRSGFQVFPEKRRRGEKQVDKTATMQMEVVDDGLRNHAANLLECMRTRALPACDIETGHRSSAACLLGNIALRTHQRIAFDPSRQELVGASEAARKLFVREYRAPWKLQV